MKLSCTFHLIFVLFVCAFASSRGESQTFTAETVTTSGGYGLGVALRNSALYFSHYSADGRVYFTQKQGGVWTTETIESDVHAMPSSRLRTQLIFDGAVPHVFYYHDVDGDLQHAYHDGDSWIVESIESAGVVGAYPSAIRCQNTKFCICYQDVDAGDLKLAIGTTGAWTIESADNSANTVGLHCSLIETPSGEIHVAHLDDTARRLRVSSRAVGGAWSSETIASDFDNGMWPSIARNPDGALEVAYTGYKNDDTNSADLGFWFATKPSGGSWSGQNVDPSFVGGYPHLWYNSEGRQRAFYRYLRYSALFGSAGSLQALIESDSGTTLINFGSDFSCFPRYQHISSFEDSDGTMYVAANRIVNNGCDNGVVLFTAPFEPTPTPTATPNNTDTPTPTPTSAPQPTVTPTPPLQSTPTPTVTPTPTSTAVCVLKAKKTRGSTYQFSSKLVVLGKIKKNASYTIESSLDGVKYTKKKSGKSDAKKGTVSTLISVPKRASHRIKFGKTCTSPSISVGK